MHRHFIVTARISAVVFLASLALIFILPSAKAQDQTQIDNLRKDVSYLNSRVCGVTAPADPAAKKVYDDQKQALADAGAALIAALDQQKGKLTGNDLDTTLRKQMIDDEEKSLKQPCPALPEDLEKLISAAAPVGTAAPAAAPTPLPQVTVAPSTVSFDKSQTIGSRSDPILVTVTNNSSHDLDMFIWYGTHLANFWITDDTCNGLTPPKGTCTFKVAFTPTEMPAPDRRGIIENLRVVSREDWKVFDKARLRNRGVTEAENRVEKAAAKAREQWISLPGSRRIKRERKNQLKSTPAAIQFCEGDKGAQLEACTDLKDADAKLKEIQNSNKATEANFQKSANDLRDKALAVIPLSGTANHWKYPLTRAVVGVDVSAVSSQTVKQAYFVDLDLLAPFRLLGNNEDALEDRWWFWLNPRITSLPKATDFGALSTINESGTFFTNFSDHGTVGDIAQGFDLNGGLEFAMLKPRDGIPWWGEYVNTRARLGLSAIVGVGISTPFSIHDTDVPSQANQSICDAFKAPAGVSVSGKPGLVCTFPSGSTNPLIIAPNPAFDPTNPMSPATVQDQFIEFFTPQRSRFFRRYYAGLRLKTYFFSPDVKGDCNPQRTTCEAPYDLFPGIIDLTVGQDEAVTAGGLKNILLRAEGVYPLPFVPGLHVFGSIYTSRGNGSDRPFNTFTVNTPAEGIRNDLNTFRFGLPPLNRDYFRVGIGIDLIQVLKRNKGGQPTTNTAATASQGDGGGTTPATGK